MNVVFRHPGRYLTVHWLVTAALAIGLFLPRHDATNASISVTLITGQTLRLDASAVPIQAAGMTGVYLTASDNYAVPDASVWYVGHYFDPRVFDVLLAYHYGMTREEISSRFGRPVATVKTWLRRSLAQLRDCLGQ